MVGAGAIISYLKGSKSSESEVAEMVFNQYSNKLSDIIRGCSSGQELIERGFPEDIDYAIKLNSSETVPLLKDKAFVGLE